MSSLSCDFEVQSKTSTHLLPFYSFFQVFGCVVLLLTSFLVKVSEAEFLALLLLSFCRQCFLDSPTGTLFFRRDYKVQKCQRRLLLTYGYRVETLQDALQRWGQWTSFFQRHYLTHAFLSQVITNVATLNESLKTSCTPLFIIAVVVEQCFVFVTKSLGANSESCVVFKIVWDDQMYNMILHDCSTVTFKRIKGIFKMQVSSIWSGSQL